MTNYIRHLEIHDHSLVPASAEVRITVRPERLTPMTELRGRLTGPRCPYADTVEVAYPLRPLPQSPDNPNALTARVVIPEASLWEPESPFLYEGAVELWQDGACCDRVALRHGLRAVRLGPAGLRVNGRPLTLHGQSLTACTDAEGFTLRQAGVNLLVAPIAGVTLPLWELADRLGFFVLGRLAASATIPDHVPQLATHSGCLGWLLDARASLPSVELLRAFPAGTRVGLELDAPLPSPPPAGVHFLCGPMAVVSELAASGLPVLGRGADLPNTQAVLGRME
jgi:hypothetical protein